MTCRGARVPARAGQTSGRPALTLSMWILYEICYDAGVRSAASRHVSSPHVYWFMPVCVCLRECPRACVCDNSDASCGVVQTSRSAEAGTKPNVFAIFQRLCGARRFGLTPPPGAFWARGGHSVPRGHPSAAEWHVTGAARRRPWPPSLRTAVGGRWETNWEWCRVAHLAVHTTYYIHASYVYK